MGEQTCTVLHFGSPIGDREETVLGFVRSMCLIGALSINKEYFFGRHSDRRNVIPGMGVVSERNVPHKFNTDAHFGISEAPLATI
jgi:hypothetical protein